VIRVGSLFAGVGGFDLGFERAGTRTAWQVENDPACLRVLKARFPDARRYGDVREVHGSLAAVDLVCGGFPCQDLSVAGRRAGLAGARSGLWHEFRRVVSEVAPAWVIVENVPGLLSSNGGRDMGTVLGGLGELGYGWAYRVLDAQWFGVAQRRRRVFIVGRLGDGAAAAEVLLEPEGREWNPPPRRAAGARAADVAAGCASAAGAVRDDSTRVVAGTVSGHAAGGYRNDLDTAGAYVVEDEREALPPLLASMEHEGPGYNRDELLVPVAFNWYASDPGAPGDMSPTIRVAGGQSPAVAFQPHGAERGNKNLSEISPSLCAGTGESGNYLPRVILPDAAVRRLTPKECARLQGFPDDWLDLDPPLADGPKYRMLGNAVCVNVSEWIGRRIAAHEARRR
jgi:DNA (cytosine-5)-methyltransferase 1